MTPEDILHFWFAESGAKKWHNGGDAFDADIRARFEMFASEAAAALKQEGQHPWEATSDGTLALILTLDQFSRNMYRDTKGAFAYDALALALAQRAIDKGHDLKTSQTRRAFFYMPFMHAENMEAQDECVRLSDMRLDSDSTVFHAKEHRKLIARFGRFPYRNKTLGRVSTPEEIIYLEGKGYRP